MKDEIQFAESTPLSPSLSPEKPCYSPSLLTGPVNWHQWSLLEPLFATVLHASCYHKAYCAARMEHNVLATEGDQRNERLVNVCFPRDKKRKRKAFALMRGTNWDCSRRLQMASRNPTLCVYRIVWIQRDLFQVSGPLNPHFPLQVSLSVSVLLPTSTPTLLF